MLGCLLALLLGSVFSAAMLLPDLTPATTIQVDVDVVYAYFGVQNFNGNITGLWINTSDPLQLYTHRLAYFIVLNVTNRSNNLAYIDEFEVAVAPSIAVQDGGTEITNKVVGDTRTVEWYPGFSQYWSPNQSRLIGLSGITDVHENAYPALSSGALYLWGRVQGTPLGEKSTFTGYSLKHVQLQVFGEEFLYNVLLSQNQMLRIEGLDVIVQPGR
jgi:hypothetical protein